MMPNGNLDLHEGRMPNPGNGNYNYYYLIYLKHTWILRGKIIIVYCWICSKFVANLNEKYLATIAQRLRGDRCNYTVTRSVYSKVVQYYLRVDCDRLKSYTPKKPLKHHTKSYR